MGAVNVGGKEPLRELTGQETHPMLLENGHIKEMEHKFQSHGIRLSYLSFPRRYNATAGTTLQRCISEVNSFRNKMNRKLCVFKVGLTSSPILRFEFYKDASYTHMSLLHVSEHLGAAQMLEAALIAMHISEKGCRNERYGGEGPPCSHGEKFHYVYVVGARADQLKPIR